MYSNAPLSHCRTPLISSINAAPEIITVETILGCYRWNFTFIRFCQIDSVLISIDARDRDESHLDQVCQWIEEAEDGHDNLALTWADMMNDLKCGVAQNLPLSSSSSAEGNKHWFINQWLYDLRLTPVTTIITVNLFRKNMMLVTFNIASPQFLSLEQQYPSSKSLFIAIPIKCPDQL
jgi:hypothetical protein